MQFTATPARVASGESTVLSWSAPEGSTCEASGGWSGSQSATGTFTTPPLTVSTTFNLSCSGGAHGTMGRVTVRVREAGGDGVPKVDLSSTNGSVPAAGSTTLAWSASDADSCVASGGWSGTVPTQGSRKVSGIAEDTTYTLTCSGARGNGIAMTEVMVQRATLRWEGSSGAGAPAAFRVLWGQRSGTPENQITVSDPGARERVIDLPGAGTYYFILAALDAAGAELSRSNQVSKTLPR